MRRRGRRTSWPRLYAFPRPMSLRPPRRHRLQLHPREGENMANITHLGRVLVPVSDQDEAIAWYSDKLGFSLSADTAFGEGDRWVEVAPPAGGATVALVPARDEYPAGRMTGIALDSSDPRADHADFQAKGLDVDAEIMGGDGVVPLLFFLRDLDGNHLMVVEAQPQ